MRSPILGGLAVAGLLASAAPSPADPATTERAKKFLDAHTAKLRPLEVAAGKAWWDANTSGKDEDFGRGDAPWDLNIVNTCGPHHDGPNPCLGLIDKPPYYAAQIVVSDLGTKGGLKTDDHSRVLREDGSVIAGLYASGNTMAPMTGRIYPGAGGPVGSSMVFSYIAALDMAGADD